MNGLITLCNFLLIVATVLVSYLGFRSREIEEKYIFHPERILAGKEYYRLVTSAFLHANWRHLAFNMFSLYLFGGPVEMYVGKAQFLSIYFGAVIGGDLLSLYVHRHHEYRSYGASGWGLRNHLRVHSPVSWQQYRHVFSACLHSGMAVCNCLHAGIVLRAEGKSGQRGARCAS